MSPATLSDADVRLRDAVLEQLEWDARLNASGIGVTADGGTVTLTGLIDSCAGKLAARSAAKRVRGVRAVANDIEVRLTRERTDADIAADVTRTLEASDQIPSSVQAVVRKRHVTLTGKVDWLFQKNHADHAVRKVRGVRSVADYISVEPRATTDTADLARIENRLEPPDEMC
jgi:osmotically-inducible protein OsmY